MWVDAQLGPAIDRILLGAAMLASGISRLLGLERAGPRIPQKERALFARAFGPGFDLDAVQIRLGGLMSVGAARAVRNTIYLPEHLTRPDGTLSPRGRQVLRHEIAHVWQYQRFGDRYMRHALAAQFLSWVRTGSRRSAYDWRTGLTPDTRFLSLNPEQQAEVIAELLTRMAEEDQGLGRPLPPTGAEVRLLREAQAWIYG